MTYSSSTSSRTVSVRNNTQVTLHWLSRQ